MIQNFYGFLKRLETGLALKGNLEEDRSRLVLLWDSPINWRKKVYSEYKRNREERRREIDFSELFMAIDVIKSNPAYLQYELEGFEADDIIGAYVHRVRENRKKEKAGMKDLVVIISNDKDMMQLVEEGDIIDVVQLRSGKKWSLVTSDSFYERFGVAAKDFASVLALAGDSSDNLPGVSGIGEKRAFVLIREFGALKNWLHMELEDFEVNDRIIRLLRRCKTQEADIRRNFALMSLKRPKILKKIKFKNNLLRKDV